MSGLYKLLQDSRYRRKTQRPSFSSIPDEWKFNVNFVPKLPRWFRRAIPLRKRKAIAEWAIFIFMFLLMGCYIISLQLDIPSHKQQTYYVERTQPGENQYEQNQLYEPSWQEKNRSKWGN